MFYVYVIKNTSTQKIYIGQTKNLEKRILRHNGDLKNKNTSFTHKQISSGKWECIYKEKFVTRSEAKAREKELKSSRGRAFIKTQIKVK